MNPRRRIVRLFGYGIVLPCLLLGFLAFRGIRNDRALVEKQRLEELRRVADQIIRAVDEGLSSAETALRKTAEAHRGDLLAARTIGLQKADLGNPLIEQVFYRGGSGAVFFPMARLLYVPDGSRPAPAETAASAEWLEAERLEFREKDNPRALTAYRTALERAVDSGRAAALNAMARVQKKSGRLRESLESYRRIVRELNDALLPGGLPLGPSAALEIGGIERELGDISGAVRDALETYRSLVRARWNLERSEFELFVQRARDAVEELLKSRPANVDPAPVRKEYLALGEEERERRAATERILLFRAGAAPVLGGKTGAASEMDSRPGFHRLAIEAGGGHFLISMERSPGRPGGEPDEIWGIIIDEDRLARDVLGPALRDRSAAGEIPWVVRGKQGGVVLASGEIPSKPPLFRSNFPANVPDWTLEFYPSEGRSAQPFLLFRRGVSSLVFLLIAGILAFGLVLTVRSVSHELELARLKSDFVSTVSHEFKSPLTSIRQIAEMLQAGRVPSEERRQTYYDVLLEQSERLSLLTDNILGLAKIEEGRAEFKFEPTDIAALLTEVVSSFRERVRHEDFEIGLDVEDALPLLAADRTALSQAVANLIDNAIKYSGTSRKIEVGASLEETAVAISVRDFGIGIKKEDRDRVFDRFFRGGDELTRAVKGSGLGLTLVRRIVEAHRGSIRLESEPGPGSVFTIRLPIPQHGGGEK
jgi:signal transduction histidine kinase/tetratricopeptide (TPR) repeat protein